MWFISQTFYMNKVVSRQYNGFIMLFSKHLRSYFLPHLRMLVKHFMYSDIKAENDSSLPKTIYLATRILCRRRSTHSYTHTHTHTHTHSHTHNLTPVFNLQRRQKFIQWSNWALWSVTSTVSLEISQLNLQLHL